MKNRSPQKPSAYLRRSAWPRHPRRCGRRLIRRRRLRLRPRRLANFVSRLTKNSQCCGRLSTPTRHRPSFPTGMCGESWRSPARRASARAAAGSTRSKESIPARPTARWCCSTSRPPAMPMFSFVAIPDRAGRRCRVVFYRCSPVANASRLPMAADGWRWHGPSLRRTIR